MRLRLPRFAAVLAWWLLLPAAPPAAAASHSISYSLWVVSGDSVLLRYTLPKEELRYLVPAGWPAPAMATVSSYLLKSLTVRSDAGACPAIDQGYDIGSVDPLAAAPDLYSFEIMYRCVDPRGLTLTNAALFDRAAHTDFARVQRDGGPVVPVLFTAGHPELRLPDSGPPRRAGAGSYLRLGALHVLHDPEGACLLLALALVLTRRRDLTYVFAGLALGYTVATLLAAANLAALRPAAAEAWTGLLIACLALLRVVPQAPLKPPLAVAAAGALGLLAAGAALLHQSLAALLLVGGALFAAGFLQLSTRMTARLWLLPTLLFGLLDGFVLTADWDTLQVTALMPATGMAAFNAGVLLTDMSLCAAAAGALALARDSRIAVAGPLASDLSTAALVGLGMFWLLSPVVLR